MPARIRATVWYGESGAVGSSEYHSGPTVNVPERVTRFSRFALTWPPNTGTSRARTVPSPLYRSVKNARLWGRQMAFL